MITTAHRTFDPAPVTARTPSVAIVVPTYRAKLAPDEVYAVRHLKKYLAGYPTFLALPKSLKSPLPEFKTIRFEDEYFLSVDAYNRLLLSRHFYEEFEAYDYILIYQLDCLVFRDELLAWCQRGFDYIGAPFVLTKSDPRRGFSRTGNGGLSLRHVQNSLKVLDSRRYLNESVSLWQDFRHSRLPDLQTLGLLQRVVRKLQILREVRMGVKAYTKGYTVNEDRFWSDRAPLFYPEFKIAPIAVALQFAFEIDPRFCYDQNGQQLPFGCHAWAKWDRSFWQPHLLTEDTGN